MTHDVTQWLNEIKTLQQQLAEVQQQRDDATESASQWRERYNMEGQQRRQEAQEFQKTVTQLKGEIERLKSYGLSQEQQEAIATNIETELTQLTTVPALKQRLEEVLLERDQLRIEVNRLVQALEKEQEEHYQTRQSLTIALGDTVDLLTKAQGGKKLESQGGIAGEHSGDEGKNREDGDHQSLPARQQKPLLRLPQWPG